MGRFTFYRFCRLCLPEPGRPACRRSTAARAGSPPGRRAGII